MVGNISCARAARIGGTRISDEPEPRSPPRTARNRTIQPDVQRQGIQRHGKDLYNIFYHVGFQCRGLFLCFYSPLHTLRTVNLQRTAPFASLVFINDVPRPYHGAYMLVYFLSRFYSGSEIKTEDLVSFARQLSRMLVSIIILSSIRLVSRGTIRVGGSKIFEV